MADGEYALPAAPSGPPLVDEDHTWVIHGRAYDLRAFAARHPGGSYALSLGAGRDCTAMFESYHALSGDGPRNMLAKYEVHDRQKVVDKLRLYKWKEEDPFYAELKSEVRATLKANGITSHKASNVRWAFFWFGFVTQFVPLYYFLQGYWVSLVVLPLWLWVFSVNYFHDASHFALSKSSTVNRIVTHLFPYFESPTTWAHQHIIGHHAYTNHDDQDPDVMDRLKSRKKLWRWSYFYWPLFTFMGCFIFDAAFFYYTLKYKQKVPMAKSVKNVLRYLAHIFGRLLVAYGMFVVPFQLFEPAKAFFFATVPLGVFGTCFGALTQLSHMTPDTYGNRNKSKTSWAAHEVLTTQNISTNSTFWFIFSGALNLQIEHHLFPGMCSEYFPLIVPVVKKVCAKHAIAYQESTNYLEGFRLHRRLLDSTCTEGGFWG